MENVILFKPDVLLLDLYFEKEGSSHDLIEEIKSIGQTAVLVMSAQTDIREALGTIQDGADNYIVKDKFFEADLQASLNAIFSKVDLQRQNALLTAAIFDADNYPIVVFGFTEMGVEPVFRDFETFPEDIEMDTDTFLVNTGVSFMMLLGRGNTVNEGCFSFPAPNSNFYNVLLFSFRLPNPDAIDERLKNGYYQLAFFIPRSFYFLLPRTEELGFMVNKIKTELDNARNLNKEKVIPLAKDLLAEIAEMTRLTGI